MKNHFLSLLIICIPIIASCKHRSTSIETFNNKNSNPFMVFKDEGLFGTKDLQGRIIVPAKYDSIYFEKGIVVAKQGEVAYFFDGDKQVFDTGMEIYSLEDHFITTFNNETGLSALYFYKNKLPVQDINPINMSEDVFMLENLDHYFAFYSFDGDVIAEGLKDIICLKKLSKEGRIKQTLFLFSKDNEDDRFIYDEEGNLKYQISLTTWQLLGLTYMAREEDEYNDYRFTYTYRINLDVFMHDRALHRTKQYYPPED